MELRDFRKICHKFIICILVCCVFTTLFCPQSVCATYLKNIEDINFGEWDNVVGVNIGPEYTMNESRYEGIKELSNFHYLSYIQVSESNKDLSSYQGVLYNKDKTLLMCFPQALKKAAIPRTCIGLTPEALYGTSRSVRNQVKRIITKNNGGVWPGYTMYVNPINQGQEIEHPSVNKKKK